MNSIKKTLFLLLFIVFSGFCNAQISLDSLSISSPVNDFAEMFLPEEELKAGKDHTEEKYGLIEAAKLLFSNKYFFQQI